MRALPVRFEHLGYASFADAPVRESAALASHDAIADDDRDLAHYGAQKAACEREGEAAFGERALVVRPGLIVGPRDRSGRFSYWPWRALAGGAMLVPDVPSDVPIQIIDVRDLADLMVRLVEDELSGVYNVTGPAPDTRLDWPRLVDACLAAAAKRGAPPAQVVRVAETSCSAKASHRGASCRVWCPRASRRSVRSRASTAAAIAAGLVMRPLAETIEAVLDEASGLVDADPRRRGKLTPTREADLIARRRARAG